MRPREKIRRNLTEILIVVFCIYDVSLLYFWAQQTLLRSALLVFSFILAGCLAWIIRVWLSRRTTHLEIQPSRKPVVDRAYVSILGGEAIAETTSTINEPVPQIVSQQSPIAKQINDGVPPNIIHILIILFVSCDFILLYFCAQASLLTSALIVLLSALAGFLAWEFRAPTAHILSRPLTVSALVLSALTVTCFSLYSGFTTIFFPITQDHILVYDGPRYALAHPAFAFVMGYPHRIPLWALYLYLVQSLTRDTQWLNVIASLLTHILNAFLVFKIAGLLCGDDKVIPRVIAAFVFLISVGHHATLLIFAHSYPILNTFFGLLSIYYFLKVNYACGEYKRGELYLSIVFYLLSVSCGSNFIALPLFYLIVIAFRVRRFRSDLIWTSLLLVAGVAVLFRVGDMSAPQYGVMMANSGDLLSASRLAERVSIYEYSFLYTLSLFFLGVPAAIATFFYDSGTVLADVGAFHGLFFRYFSLFVLVVPLSFLLDRARAVRLYALVGLMFLLFVPFILAPRALNQRHFSQTLPLSALFLGLLTHYVLEAIRRIRVDWLRTAGNWSVIFFWAIFGVRLAMVSRNEIAKFIRYQSSVSASIQGFVDEFKKVRVQDQRKQIYLLTNRIPKTASFIGNPDEDCYYFYYLATKYNGLPIDLYRYVYIELETSRPVDWERCKNYFIRLDRGDAFGFFTDRGQLKRVLEDNPDIGLEDVIVLTWEGGLRQGRLVGQDDL